MALFLVLSPLLLTTNRSLRRGFLLRRKLLPNRLEVSGASFDQDGEARDAGWAQVMKDYKAAKKARVKKAKADNAAKTDGASAAPQYSGEYSFGCFCLRLREEHTYRERNIHVWRGIYI